MMREIMLKRQANVAGSNNLVGVQKLKELGGERLLGFLAETRGLGSLGADLGSDRGLGVRIESEHDSAVLERVLALGERSGGLGWALGANNRLDFIRVDQTCNISVGNLGLGHGEARLGGKDFVQTAESRLSENNESAEVSSRSELKQVEALDRAKLNTGQVAESLDNTGVVVVDDQWSTSLCVSSVAQLANTSTNLAGVGDFDDIGVSTDRLEQSNSFLGLGQALGSIGDHKRDLLNLLDTVAASKHERGDSSGSQRRGSSVSLLVLVGLDEPSAPQLSRSEHVTTAGHVTESSLT